MNSTRMIFSTAILLALVLGSCGGKDKSAPTASQSPAPVVISTTPADGAKSVSASSTFTVVFSEEIDPATISDATFRLGPENASQIVSGALSVTDSTLMFAPTVKLEYNTVYTAILTTGVKSKSGHALSENYTWSFTTESTVSPGTWGGQDISFSVSANSDTVKNLSVTYNGHARGTLCGFDYTTTSTIRALSISDRSFRFIDSELTIIGDFTDPNNAKIDVSWSRYNGNCDASYSGSRVYSASYPPNSAPVANAGANQVVGVGAQVQLDGSGSRDEDGDMLTYQWTTSEGVLLSSATVASPTFEPSVGGTYRFSLTVNDGKVNSVPAEVVIVVLSARETLTATLPGGTTMEMVWIDPGTFTMGSPDSEPERGSNEGPQHQVTISKGFYLGKYEITQGQWERVMGTEPWSGQESVQADPSNPAVNISWDDLQVFVDKLNQGAGDSLYRLPTEAEWEYACRAETTTIWSFGDDERQLGNYAWHRDNAWSVGEQYAHAVGTKLPNDWGLYDMHGNVLEWCQDWEGPYTSRAQTDPIGPTSGTGRVQRGGTFSYYAAGTRSGFRISFPPSHHFRSMGARILRIR